MNEMVNTPGKYIFASPRTELIDEREQDLNRLMAGANCKPLIRSIHSGKKRRHPVSVQIIDAIAEFEDHSHVILQITHEGLMSADLANIKDWHVVVDEVPNAVLAGKLDVPTTVTLLKASYDLVPVAGANWSRLRVRDDAPDSRSFMLDDLGRALVSLDRRARSPQGAYVDVLDWEDARLRGRKLSWWSAWTLLDLRSAASVTIAAAGYEHSILAKVTQNLHPNMLQITKEQVQGRTRQPRKVIIRYFADMHRGSSTYLLRKGKPGLTRILKYISNREIGYWSANTDIMKYFEGHISGEMVSPKAEGTNSLSHYRCCFYIYSSKATKNDDPLISSLGLSREEIERAREIEDVIQFAGRGDLRNPDSTDDYLVFLYDRFQAEALAAYIEENGLGQPVIEPVEETGLLGYVRAPAGRPRAVPQETITKAQRDEALREKDKERKKREREAKRQKLKAEGTYRGPGAPHRK
ncbi:hypothetical protein [Salinarimonas ramus]|nr:hypothetical protein [Salinarimonas ramus]